MALNFDLTDLATALADFDQNLAVNAFFLIAVLVIASYLIYRFYNSIAKRNLISLNLYKYNTSDHPILHKLMAMALYLVEYIFLIPLFIILWFGGLSLALLLLEKDGSGVEYILLITATLIGAIRVLSYVKKELAIDLAKLFPFITLSAVLLAPGAFSLKTILLNLTEVPTLLSHILSYVFVIFFVEILLRTFYTLYEFWASEDAAVKKRED